MRGRLFIFICVNVSLVFSYAFWLIVQHTKPQRELPVHFPVIEDLTSTERSGAKVSTDDLRGKVCVIAYIYTVCHHGCATVLAEMSYLNKKYGHRPDFQLVSLAVVPKQDTPEFFKNYAPAVGVKTSDPWWFLSGDTEAIGRFATDELRLAPATIIPEDERLNPLETHSHDLRIVLLDRQHRVRGYYNVIHPIPEVAKAARKQLRTDTRSLLNNP